MYRAVYNFSLYIREMNKYLHSVTFLVKSNEITMITNAILENNCVRTSFGLDPKHDWVSAQQVQTINL